MTLQGHTGGIVANLTLVLEAARIAAKHGDDHPFQVALDCVEEDIVLALLHDSIEDGYSTEDYIITVFGSEMLMEVLVLTRDVDNETYMEYIKRVKEFGGRPLRVKQADLIINYHRSFPGHHLLQRYEKALKYIGEEVI